MKLTNLLNSKKIRTIGFLILLGLIYSIIIRYTSFCIPCFFNIVTGLKCPGCGITHMFLYLMDFDFYNAFSSNVFLFTTLPLLLLILILNFICNDKIRKKPFTKRLTFFYLISLLIWAIIRNIIKI